MKSPLHEPPRADASLDMHRVYRCPLIVIVPLRYRVFRQSITKRSTLKFDPICLRANRGTATSVYAGSRGMKHATLRKWTSICIKGPMSTNRATVVIHEDLLTRGSLIISRKRSFLDARVA